MSSDNEFLTLTIAEVASLLRVDRRTVYRLIERGELQSVRVGRAWRVFREALAAFIHGGRHSQSMTR